MIYKADPDQDVLTGLMSGDERALKELMRRHLDRIHRTAMRILGDAALAEDVAQTVFLKTWEMAPNWVSGKARLLSWMLRVTTRQCLDILKKKAPIYTDDMPDISDTSDLADKKMIKDDSAKMVRKAIERLPNRQKIALTLSYYENVSQRDGAEIMDITVGAYEALLVRARKTLKNTLIRDAEISTERPKDDRKLAL